MEAIITATVSTFSARTVEDMTDAMEFILNGSTDVELYMLSAYMRGDGVFVVIPNTAIGNPIWGEMAAEAYSIVTGKPAKKIYHEPHTDIWEAK